GKRQSVVAAFSAGTGKLTHVGRGMTTVEPTDIDNDGIDDLVVFDAHSDRLDFGGKLHVLRGVANEPWRRIGNMGEAAADFDADGVIDLIHLWGDGSLVVTSGRSGKSLWQCKLESGYQCRGARPAGADLDSDGTEDLLAWTDTSGPRRRSYPFHAISGRSGRVLWNAGEIDAQMVGGVLTATAADLDRDGKAEVIWVVASDHGYPVQRESWSSHDVQVWLFVVSGQTGSLRWKQPLSRAFGDKPGDHLRMNADGTRVAPAIGDVNGDGTKDVILPAVVGEGQIQSLETRVLSGEDGKLLWRRPFLLDSNRQESLELWVPPAICDLDGDGRQEVAFVELFAADAPAGGGATRYRIVASNGSDGKPRWSWNSQVHASYWSTIPGQSRGLLMRPLILAARGQGHRVAALLPGSEGKVAVLNADGSAQERKIGHQSNVSGIWACDVDRDGVEEVVFLDQSRLVVAPADKLDQPLWTYDTGSAGSGRILEISSAGEDQPPVIAFLPEPTDNTVLGFDSATGKRVWTCPGPIPRADDTSYLMANQLAMLGGAERELPFVYCAYASVARCRQAADVAQRIEGTLTVAHPSTRGVTASSAVLKTAARDPRWLRNLPWVEEHISWRQGATFIVWGLFFSTFLVVIPAGYLARLVWLRRFGLRTLLVLPIIAGLFLTAALLKAPLDNDFATLVGRLSIGAVLAPAVVGLVLLCWWSVSGQMPRAALWLAMTVVLSFICAAVALRQSQQYRPLLPEESYDWMGWYLIWFSGAYITAWMVIVVLPVKYAILTLWKWWKSRSATVAGSIASAATIAVTPIQSAAIEKNP
ncbi:MAG: VCBS repeat-containing protein, partial [Pirellulaceae bacterium]